jgi:hypothetical protein
MDKGEITFFGLDFVRNCIFPLGCVVVLQKPLQGWHCFKILWICFYFWWKFQFWKKMNFEKHVHFDSSQHQCQASSNMSSTLNLPRGPQISGMSQRSCLLLVTSRESGHVLGRFVQLTGAKTGSKFQWFYSQKLAQNGEKADVGCWSVLQLPVFSNAKSDKVRHHFWLGMQQ